MKKRFWQKEKRKKKKKAGDLTLDTQLVKVLPGVLIFYPVGDVRVEFEGGGEVLEVVIVGQLVADDGVKENRGLVGPAACHISDGVSSPTEHEGRDPEGLDKPDALAVAPEAQAEAAEAVAAERVSAALENNGGGPVDVHD